jgi:hypothetical protein
MAHFVTNRCHTPTAPRCAPCLCACLVGIALHLISRPIDPRDYLFPTLLAIRSSSLLEILVRVAVSAGGPLSAIAWVAAECRI